MNHMNEVAKMLGVEIGEEFYIKVLKNALVESTLIEVITEFKFKLTEYGLIRVGTNERNDLALHYLLIGYAEIIKLPFKPRENEKFWLWRKKGKGRSMTGWSIWEENTTDKMCYMLGNCYRTEAECEADTAMKERIEKMGRCKW